MARWGSRIILVAAPLAIALLVSMAVCGELPGDQPVTVEPEVNRGAAVHKHSSTTCAPLFNRRPWQWHDSVGWSADGQKILFNIGPRLYVVGADGVGLRSVADASAEVSRPEFVVGPMTSFDVSPDGQQVVYSTCEYPGIGRVGEIEGPDPYDYEYELAITTLEYGQPRRVTEDNRFDNYPVWSPDGERIAFVQAEDVGDDLVSRVTLHTMAADGTDRQIEAGRVVHHPPAWSPKGERIAYLGRNKHGENAIYVLEEYENLLTDAVSGPSWSPDGERIAYAKADGDEVALYTIAADGTNARRLAAIDGWEPEYGEPDPAKAWIRKVSWSPDGSRIMVFANQYSAPRIHVIAGDDTAPTPLAVRHPIVRSIGDAAWSPDGTRIAMSGEFESKSLSYDPDVYHVLLTMAADGTDLRVLAGTGEDGDLESQGAVVLENVVTGAAKCGDGVMVPEPEANPGLVEDCEVLLEIHDRLTGGGVLDWSWDSPISQWQGVVVVGSPPRVRKIMLRGDLRGTIRGTIPPELGRLTGLRELDMSRNLLTGGIPPELGELENLERLDLTRNYLSGTIPPELGGLSQLTYMSLGRNNLRGEIPAELGRLTSLTHLTVSANLLTLKLPESLKTLADLAELEELYVAYNAITGCIPEAFREIEQTDVAALESRLPDCE